MYVKTVQLIDYGPIEGLEIDFPFDDDKPRPIVLVGENGSGKSILLSHIVNGLLWAQQVAYPGSPEVASGKIFKLRSSQYIRTGAEFSFANVSFEGDVSIAELQLGMRKKDYRSAPLGILNTNVQQLWNSMKPTEASAFSSQLDEVQITERFEHNCVLYFPPNRFEDPAWLNEENLKARARHVLPSRFVGETARTILNYSPLDENKNFLFELAFDYKVFEVSTYELNLPFIGNDADEQTLRVPVFQGYSGESKTIFDIVIDILRTVVQWRGARLGIGTRSNRVVSLNDDEQTRVPNIFQLSSGEVSILNIFLSILRDFDACEAKIEKPDDIRGIVVIDEVDLHLHAVHQYTILPRLIQMFPRVQFVLTTHSPLFVLGLHRALGDDGFGLYRLPSGQSIAPEEFSEFERAYNVFTQTDMYLSEVQAEIKRTKKPLIFVEGKTDVKYLIQAMSLLNWCETFVDVEIREVTGGGNLTTAWKAITKWKTATKMNLDHETIVLLHDCDSGETSAECDNIFRRKIPMAKDHPIRNGIENLFSKDTLIRAKEYRPGFINITEKHRKTERGYTCDVPEKWQVNKDEKCSLCDWLCQNGTVDDFRSFERLFNELSTIPDLLRPTTSE